MIQGLNHITVSAQDLAESLEFYCALGFKAKVKWGKGAYLALGDLWLCLSKGNPRPAGDYSHLAFTISRADIDHAQKLAKDLSWQEWQENTSEGKSLYLLDPSGHKLELHVGNLESRLHDLKQNPLKDLVWM